MAEPSGPQFSSSQPPLQFLTLLHSESGLKYQTSSPALLPDIISALHLSSVTNKEDNTICEKKPKKTELSLSSPKNLVEQISGLNPNKMKMLI